MKLFSCFSPCVRQCTTVDQNGALCGSSVQPPPLPIMESCASEALTNTVPVQILSGDAQPWRVASPQDQSLLSQLSPGCLTPLTLLGEGAYGCVELCRVSVSIPITPYGQDSREQQLLTEQRSENTPGDCSTTSRRTTGSFEDSLRNPPAADPVPSSAAGTAITAVGEGPVGSEPVLSAREEVIVRAGRFCVNRLRLSPRPMETPEPSPCATPPAASRRARFSRLHSRQGPLRASAPAGTMAAAAGAFPCEAVGGVSGVGLATGASPAGVPAPIASGAYPTTPTSAYRAPAANVPSGTSSYAGFTLGSFFSRARSVGSAVSAHSAPPSARSPKVPPQSSSAAYPSTPAYSLGNGSGNAASSVVLSNELVVAVKRVGYRRPSTRSGGDGGRGREPDGSPACRGGAVGRGRGGGGGGPSRTRLNRMQAIELLQLARCRDCPFIVRVFGCVQDDPRSAAVTTVAGSGGSFYDGGVPVGSVSSIAAGGGTATSKLSQRRPPASSSSSSCRIVMEWAEGGDLGSLIKTLSARRGPCSDPSRERLLMSEASARFYLGCLLEALSFLHGKGLLHRDVKPANLLLTSDGRAKLGDLGMVCHMDRDGLAAGRAGTPNYMAPEVWAYGTAPKYSSYGANADLWSAGLVLYEMLTGHLPASHPDEYLRGSWCFTPRHAAFSAELRDLLSRLLVPRPRRRLQSCAEMAAHPWFACFDWQGLRDGTLAAPYVPAAHRPLSSAATTASRLRQPLGAALNTASAASFTAAVGVGVSLMPPLLEENVLSAAAAGSAAEVSRDASGYAMAAAKTIFRVPSVGALRQSAPASTSATAAISAASTGASILAATQAAPMSTASILEHPAASGLQPSLESSGGGTTRWGHPPRPSLFSPAAAIASPLSVWRSLGWPAATRPSHAAASAPASATSSTTSFSLACTASPQGAWMRRGGASHALVHARDAAPAGPDTGGIGGGGGGGIGFIGTMLISALSPVVAFPNASKISAAARSADAAINGKEKGMPGASPTHVITNQVGSAAAAANAAVAETEIGNVSSASAVFRASSKGGGAGCGNSRTASATQNSASSPSPNLMTSGDTNPLLLGTAVTATATGTVSDCILIRGESGTFPVGCSNSAGGGGGGHGHDGDNLNGNADGSLVWKPAPASGSLAASIDSQAPADLVIAAQSQSQLVGLLGYRRFSGTSTEPTVQSAETLPHGSDPYSPGPGAAQYVRSGPLAASPQTATGASHSSLLSAFASLQQHMQQGLGSTGRKAGSWLQQRLVDAATLAAAIPDQLQSAAAVAAVAVVGGGSGTGGGLCTVAVPRMSRSESANSTVRDGQPAEALVSTSVGEPFYVTSAVGCMVADTDTDQDFKDVDVDVPADALVCEVNVADQQSPRWVYMDDQCLSQPGVEQEASVATCCSPHVVVDDDNLRLANGLLRAYSGDPSKESASDAPFLVADPVAEQSAKGQRMDSLWQSLGGVGSACKDVCGVQHDGDMGLPSPVLLPTPTLTPSLPPTLNELTRCGSDTATVLVVVHPSAGRSGASNMGGGTASAAHEEPSSGSGALEGSDSQHARGPELNTDVSADAASSSGVKPPKGDPLLSPRLAGPRNPLIVHKRGGSFCFDPLDSRAGRLSNQLSGSPQTPRSSAQPSTPSRARVRATSFSFDVGGLLSAGLLLGGSPVLLPSSASTGATVGATWDEACGTTASMPGQSRSHNFSSDGGCAQRTAAAAVALAAVADIAAVTTSLGLPLSRGPPRPLQPLRDSPNEVATIKPTSSCCSLTTPGPPLGPDSVGALHLPGQGQDLSWGSTAEGLASHSPNISCVVPPFQQLYHQHHLQGHQWHAGEAVVLLYAACVAVLVMAWAVTREGSEVTF